MIEGIERAIDNNLLYIRQDDKDLLRVGIKILDKRIHKMFKWFMPKRYWIFPQKVNVYVMSNTLCIQFPSWGSSRYRELLHDFGMVLLLRYSSYVEYYDGKTTFLIKNIKEV